jgi:16S rRNA processing protein RimM
MDKKYFFEFGKIKKFNRKTGEISIRTNSDDAEEYSSTPLIFIEIDGGLAPFYVASAKLRDSKTIQVLLEDYASPEKARQFMDCPVCLLKKDKKIINDDEFSYDEIIGYEVIDKIHGTIGILEDILDRPEQEILQINFKGKEILIPLVDEIFEKINKSKKQLFIHSPEGLINIYLEG